MNCEELRWYFEERPHDAEARADFGAVTEHISACVDCSQFVEEQRMLGRDLAMIRQSAPNVPESLDAEVLTRYRQYIGKVKSAAPRASRFWATSAWAWSAVAAVVIVAIGLWLLSARKTVTTTTAQSTIPSSVQSANSVSNGAPAASAEKAMKTHRVSISKSHKPQPARQTVETPTRIARTLPEGFRGLMYCDALSCGEQMDMIRVQIPRSAMPRQMAGLIPTSGTVTADVLVGSDGIARGIRFEEIEF